MKKIRFKNLIAICLTVVLVFGITPSVLAQGQLQKINHFTGEDIFKGLVFGQGEVAKIFPEVWSKDMLKQANEEENQKLVTKVLDEMKKIDGSFFIQLENAVKSSNYISVDRALSTGGELLLKAIQALELDLKESDPITGTCVAVFVVLTAAIFVSYVGAVHTAAIDIQVYAAVAYWTEVAAAKSKSSANGTSQLEKEMIVGKIIRNLA